MKDNKPCLLNLCFIHQIQIENETDSDYFGNDYKNKNVVIFL